MLMQSDGAESAGLLGSPGTTSEAVQSAQNIIRYPTAEASTDWTDLLALWDAIGWPIVKAVLLIIAVLVASGWARRIVIGTTRRAKLDETLSKFFGNMARWAVMLLGGMAVLGTVGIEMISFAAVIAAMGFALGMALSGTLGNFASGVMLLVFRPFKVGDVVSAAGLTAKVDEIGLFATTFDTPDNRRFIVPNGKLFDDTIENVTHHKTRRVEVSVGISCSADLDETRAVLEAAVKAVEGGRSDPEPVVYLNELGDSSIAWTLRVWTGTADYGAVKERLTRDTKYALDKAGIGIPFPQLDVSVRQMSAD